MLANRKLQYLERHPLEIALVLLLAILYMPLLLHWVDGWINKSISIQHEYFSHGLIGLPFAAYIAWEHRQRWQRLGSQMNPAGLVIVGIGAVFYLSGLSDWINFSLPLMLVGICLTLKGSPGLRLQTFPLLLVVLATPSQVPYLIESYILPLQRFIAGAAGFLLIQFGIDVDVNQIYLLVNGQPVEVAPHCAGLKMLFTSLYVGMMLLYWTGVGRSRLQTGVFLILTAALSVVGNIIRNTLLSYFHGTGQEGAFDWLHESWGGDLYSATLLFLLIVLIRAVQHYVPPTLALQLDQNSDV
ncbi:MAG: cyanoexosortase B [Leptolyngbyaceae cyanobacterium SL_1_1]|nr:cyanoexosortase B [Leptolyngbyaceae cyanobacterium RM1_1_2]NJO08371.1 cyanoexosortase B [Leptolyngbyaceae cyanobacterium SL_1_1]